MRLIDADALKDIELKYDTPCTWFLSEDYITGAKNAMELAQITVRQMISEAPTIDHVKHGHWKETLLLKNVKHCPVVYICSECRENALTDSFKYCPNCGAKMDEETKCD